MTTKLSKYLDKIVIRVPEGMRDDLKKRAANNMRSVNSEVVKMLKEKLEVEGCYEKRT